MEVAAQAPSPEPDPPRFRSLTLDDGLPNYTVMSLLQDGPGYMWIGTQIGLSRFDGRHHRIYRASSAQADSLGDGFITSLARTTDDSAAVWVGTKLAGVHRFRPADDAFERIPGPDEAAARHVLSLLDVDGILLVGTDGAGLLTLFPGADSLRGPPSPLGRSVSGFSVVPQAPNLVLVLSELGLAALRLPDMVPVPVQVSGADLSRPVSMAWLSPERAVIATDSGLKEAEIRISGTELTLHIQPVAGISSQDVRSVLVRDSEVWVGMGDAGVDVLDAELTVTHRLSATGPESIADDAIQTLALDREGLVWIGTWANGLSIERPARRFAQVHHAADNPEGPPPSNVFGILEDRNRPGTMWVGFMYGGLAHWDPKRGVFEKRYADPDHPLNSVSALGYDHDGGLWALGRRNSVFRLRADGSILDRVALDLPPDSADGWVTFLHPRRAGGDLLIGTRGHGLVVFDPVRGVVRHRYGRRGALSAHRLDSDDIWQLVEEEDGTLWVATGLGLARIGPDGAVSAFHAHDPDDPESLSGPLVSSVVRDAHGMLWLGTPDAGLNRFDPTSGRVVRLSQEHGLPNSDVGGIVPDESGRLWLSSSRGLAVLDPSTLEIARFGPLDGVLEQTFQYRARTRLASGHIALGGPNGTLTVFDPAGIVVDSTPAMARVTDILVGGRRVPPGAWSTISLGHQEGDVLFRFSDLSFATPEKVRYRVRLSGGESGWTPADDAEVGFARLGPASYRFEVVATNRDGLWGAPGPAVELTVRPPFWQTWWFSGLMLALIAGMTAAAFQYRIRQIRRLEAERNRIANDLHDDLGSKLGSLALRLELLARRVPEQQESLTSLASFSRGAIQNLRDTIWLVATGHGAVRDLRERLEHAAGEILVDIPFAFEVSGGPMTQEMDPLRRRALLLAVREALHNVAKHSGADRVDVGMEVWPRRVQVTVRDNGRGIAAAAERAGRGIAPAVRRTGRGMHTMVDRVEAAGGETEVSTEAGVGTVVRISMPI